MAEVLGTINGIRARIRDLGVLLVLVVSHFEYDEVQRHTGDALSTRIFLEDIPFVPQPGDEDEARRALAAWLRDRFGRLDLRGFIRSEQEDVSWRVEDVYQQLSASLGPGSREPTESDFIDIERPVIVWLEAPSSHPTTIVLGHPGSGKSFFLRWLALHLIEQSSWATIERPFPILISLASYTRLGPLRTLLDYMTDWLLLQQQPVAHLLPSLMEQGRVVFLLDGLDEGGDEEARARLVDAVQDLQKSAPLCKVVVTSRIVGYTEASLEGTHLSLSPFEDSAIRGFLVRWSELYEVQLRGESESAWQRGHQQGAQLAQEILEHEQIHDLARTPLLLTVLALVHRAGLRLPDHRVELYDHALRILVERWNRIRSLSGESSQVPLKTADAARLLGPIALSMVEGGARTITTTDLRRALEASLRAGTVKGVQNADQVIDLFKNSLGLLVEQGPDTFAFLHLTLAEYLAAKELVRTSKLEDLVSSPRRAFQAEMREIILLSVGELGLIRADDERLSEVIESVCRSAASRKGRPSVNVPLLLADILADDPSLSIISANRIWQELVPKWWFQKRYSLTSLWINIVFAIHTSIRVRQGRFKHLTYPALDVREAIGTAPSDDKFYILSLDAYANFIRTFSIDYRAVIPQLPRIELNRRACSTKEVYDTNRMVSHVTLQLLPFELSAVASSPPKAILHVFYEGYRSSSAAPITIDFTREVKIISENEDAPIIRIDVSRFNFDESTHFNVGIEWDSRPFDVRSV